MTEVQIARLGGLGVLQAYPGVYSNNEQALNGTSGGRTTAGHVGVGGKWSGRPKACDRNRIRARKS